MLHLTGKSKHGKMRVKQHGNLWRVLETGTNIPCKPGQKAFFIESVLTNDRRWVGEKDEDFIVGHMVE